MSEPATASAHPQESPELPARTVFGVGTSDPDTGFVTQTPSPTFLDERGEMPVGALCVMLDHALGSRVASLLAPDDRIVTSHMHLEVRRVPPLGVERVIGRNIDTAVLPGSAFCSADAVAPGGDVLVTATGRFAIVSHGAAAGGRVESRAPDVRPEAADDPVVADEIETDSAVQRLLGLTTVTVGEGTVGTRALARPEFANERGGVHGGVGAFMCERAADLALRSRAGWDHEYRPVEMRVFFARPLPADGRALDLTTTIGFLGRTTASTSTCLLRPDGKLAVQVDITHLMASARRERTP